MVPIRTLIRTLFLNVFNRFEIQGIDSKLVLPPCGSSRKLLGALIRILIRTPVWALSTKVTDTNRFKTQEIDSKSVLPPCGSSRKLLGALIRILIRTPVCALSTKVTDTFQTHWQRLKWKSVNFPS